MTYESIKKYLESKLPKEHFLCGWAHTSTMPIFNAIRIEDTTYDFEFLKKNVIPLSRKTRIGEKHIRPNRYWESSIYHIVNKAIRMASKWKKWRLNVEVYSCCCSSSDYVSFSAVIIRNL